MNNTYRLNYNFVALNYACPPAPYQPDDFFKSQADPNILYVGHKFCGASGLNVGDVARNLISNAHDYRSSFFGINTNQVSLGGPGPDTNTSLSTENTELSITYSQ